MKVPLMPGGDYCLREVKMASERNTTRMDTKRLQSKPQQAVKLVKGLAIGRNWRIGADTLNELQRDMQYGQVAMLATTPDQDMHSNQDYVLGTLALAFRRRRFKADKYGEISIRAARATGTKTEMAKILAGECKSGLFVFEFLDCFIVCSQADIRDALERRIGYEKPNKDGITSAWYIPIDKVSHLRICKKGRR